MSIAQDELGRMWLGTREGVNMFDGTSIVSYKGWVDDPEGDGKVWIGNEVTAIRPDSTGNLFMLIDNDIVRYDIRADRFSRFTNSGKVKALAASRGAVIYISSDSIFLKNPFNDSIRFQFVIPPARGITHLAVDDKSYYVSTVNGLHVFDRTSRRHSVMMPGTHIYSSFIGRNNVLWISTANGGLYRKGINDLKPVMASMPTAPKGVMGAQQSRHAVEDSNGRIWYGSFTGLFCYDPELRLTRHIEIPTNAGGLTHSSVFGMYCDREGNIWAGTYYGGVNYFSPNHEQFVNFNYEGLAPDGLYHSFIIGMVIDRDGNLWFGTDGAGVCCVDSDWNIKTQLSTNSGDKALRQNNIKALAYDADRNRLYIGTHLGGLSVYDIDRGTTENLIDSKPDGGVPGDVIHCLKIYNDKLFIGSRTGLSVMDLDRELGAIRKLTSQIAPLRLDFDSRGDIYCVTQGNTDIYKITDYLGDNLTVTKSTALDPDSGNPTSVSCTPDGLLVSTLGHGLLFFPGYADEPQQFNAANSMLPDNYCYTLAKSADGGVYVLTSKHLVKFHPSDGKMESITFADYFPDSHIIDECALLALDNGDILVGSTKGITRLKDINFINPETATDVSGLYFSQLKVQNKPVSPADGSGVLATALPYADRIHLPHDRNNFSLRVGVSDYTTASGAPQIEYRLDGAESRWLTSDDGEIRYNSLPPGDYRLRTRRVGSTDEISIDITVDHPWYSTWWAWMIYILAAASLGYFIIDKSVDAARLRHSLRKEQVERQQIERLNREKLVFFTNVSHEFQTPLTLIISHIDLLMTKYKRNETLLEALKRVREHTQQMSHLITQLLEFRKLQQNHQVLRLDYHDASESMRHTALPFVDYAAKRAIDYTIETPEKGPEGFYDPALIDRVLVNILSNAFKYTPDGASISCKVTTDKSGRVVFKISDTGKGIAEKDLPFIFDRFYNGNSDEMKRYNMDYRSTGIGLAFAKSIVDKHHGEISVKSREGEGTTFTVVIPDSPKPFEGDSNVIFETEPDTGFVKADDIQSVSYAGEQAAGHDLPENTATQPAESDNADGGADSARPLVLIVEDNRELRHNLVKFFSTYFRIAEAVDGEDGLKKARSLNPDLIISDVMMPRMSGTEMCRRIKSDLNLCHIPVILLTALSASESKIEGLNANADDYVTKPFESAVLLARVDNLLRNRNMLKNQFDKKPVNEIDMSVVNPLDRNLIKRTSDYIESHLSDPDLDIQSLCAEMGLSRSLFYNKFKSLTGMTPNAFLLNHRLKHAAALLTAQPHLSVTEVSEIAGFNNAAYFSRCFRKQFGVSPQAYRKGETADDNSPDYP